MKALSIKQPWVELILQGRKKIEIRSWNTKYRGYFLIHASKNVNRNAIDFYDFDLEKLLRGYIVGFVNLVNVIIYKNKNEFLKDKDSHFSLSIPESYPVYGFLLEGSHRIEPISYKGKLGFFNVPENSVASSLKERFFK